MAPSPTLSMASFMDKVLLVVEAEKNNRDMLTRNLLTGSCCQSPQSFNYLGIKDSLPYTPKWLEVEL